MLPPRRRHFSRFYAASYAVIDAAPRQLIFTCRMPLMPRQRAVIMATLPLRFAIDDIRRHAIATWFAAADAAA